MSASVTMAVMAASARAALHAADGALPSGVIRAPAGERGVRYEMKSSALMRRTMFLVLTLLVPAVTVYADDWGMGRANARLPHPSMFVLMVTTAIDAALKLGFVTAEQSDEWVRPEDMTHPLR